MRQSKTRLPVLTRAEAARRVDEECSEKMGDLRNQAEKKVRPVVASGKEDRHFFSPRLGEVGRAARAGKNGEQDVAKGKKNCGGIIGHHYVEARRGDV